MPRATSRARPRRSSTTSGGSARRRRSRVKRVQDSLDELSTTLENEVADIESAADGVAGLTGLPSAISSITTSLAAMGTAFASTLQALESADVKGELQTALEDSPACANISG